MSDTAERLWDVIEPYVAAEGIELDDFEVLGHGAGTIVRVTVDGDDALSVDRIAEILYEQMPGSDVGTVAVDSLTTIFAPLVMTQIFYAFTTDTGPYFPAAAFVLSALIMVACMAVFLAHPRQSVAPS